MRNKWLGYAASLVLAAALVTASIFAPSALLSRKEAAMLGDVSYRNYGNYPNRTVIRPTVTPSPSPAPSASGSVSIVDNTAQIRRKMLIMENSAGSMEIQEPSGNDINMKMALVQCSEQIKNFIKAGAIPPLVNFPDEYTVNARMQTATTSQGDSYDFWSISFTTNAKLTKAHSSINMTVDAQTGAIYFMKMYTASTSGNLSTPDAARYITQTLGVDGSVQVQPSQIKGTDSAIWVSSDRSLFISFYHQTTPDGSAFSMYMSTKLPS